MSPFQIELFLRLSAIAPYVYPVSYVGLGLLAMRKAPWLSTVGVGCSWIGSIPWGFIAGSMFYFAAAARLGEDASFARLHSWQGLFGFPAMLMVAGGWVIGHLLGYVLRGSFSSSRNSAVGKLRDRSRRAANGTARLGRECGRSASPGLSVRLCWQCSRGHRHTVSAAARVSRRI